jgi:hypothetical protein
MLIARRDAILEVHPKALKGVQGRCFDSVATGFVPGDRFRPSREHMTVGRL